MFRDADVDDSRTEQWNTHQIAVVQFWPAQQVERIRLARERHAKLGFDFAAQGIARCCPDAAQPLGFALDAITAFSARPLRLGLYAGIALLVLAIIDYTYQRWQLEQELKMSKQEVKDEMRSMEGDPKVKQRRRPGEAADVGGADAIHAVLHDQQLARKRCRTRASRVRN